MTHFDYIIAGSGAAGLMLAYRMSQDTYFDDKKILLIDKDHKNSNDRTWCYWEKGAGEWDHIVFCKWNQIYFGSSTFSSNIDLGNHQYKMIRGDDFYNYILNILRSKSNFSFTVDEIMEISESNLLVHLKTEHYSYTSKKLFNSIFSSQKIATKPQYPYLKQHFIGWFIKTETDTFNYKRATFMDFSIEQKNNTRFMYLLPTSPNEALIECTLFSDTLLPDVDYEEAIQNYITDLGIKTYTVEEKEKGNIPMTCYPFDSHNTENIMHIGSAGGWTKASTGYTFNATSQKTKELISFIKQNQDYSKFSVKSRYWFYDLIFLNVLNRDNALGAIIFSSIFKNNKIEKVFDFLEERGSIFDDLKILFNTQPKMAFIKSALSSIKLLFFSQ